MMKGAEITSWKTINYYAMMTLALYPVFLESSLHRGTTKAPRFSSFTTQSLMSSQVIHPLILTSTVIQDQILCGATTME